MMVDVVCLCILLVKLSTVWCGILLPHDTSYGYVPRESNVFQLGKNEDLWAPYVHQGVNNRPATGNGDSVVVDAPDTNFRNYNVSSGDGNFQNNVSQSRSPKFSQFPSGFYYYEPPPPQYLPPPLETYPDYATSKPTDEEFFNKPPNDYPQDVAISGYNYDAPNVPLDGLLPPYVKDESLPNPPSSQYLPVTPAPPSGLYDAPYYGTRGSDSNTNSIGDSGDGFTRQKNSLNMEVTNMHCFDTPSDGRFQSTITVRTSNDNTPVFEDILPSDASSCVVKTEIIQPRVSARYKITIPKSRFKECAVRDCSVNKEVVHLCVRLRFPTIPRMKLADDTVLTLQCRTQDRIAAHTKHLAVNIDNSIAARSSDIAKGGSRGGLRSQMSLYRRGSRGDHSELLPRGAKVPLGELLMLRAQIEAKDGWLASRMSTVTLTGPNGVTMPLLGLDGCRESRARALCPRDSKTIGPLGHILYIRAAMFEGMRSGDEMRLSVRMVACLDPADCRQPKCLHGGNVRNRRELNERKEIDYGNYKKRIDHNQTVDAMSILSFKVVLPEDYDFNQDDLQFIPRNQTPLIVMLIVLCATIICSSVLIFIKRQCH